MKPRDLEVPAERLRWRCDSRCFTFQCTDELIPLQEFIGQDRAIKAIGFGLAVDQPGYNIFVTGMTGTGKSSIVKAHLESVVAERLAAGTAPQPSDWCYIFNFADTDRPDIVRLPAGRGKDFKVNLERLQDELRAEVPKAFSGEEYEAQRKQIANASQTAQQQIFRELEEEARAAGFAVQFSPVGVALVPLIKGRPASQEEYLQLDARTKHELEEKRAPLLGRVEETVNKARDIDRSATERLEEVSRKVAGFAIDGPFRRMTKAYADHKEIADFLAHLRAFSIDHVDIFQNGKGTPSRAESVQEVARIARQRDTLIPFVVNVFVDNSEAKGPPIVVENNPTFSNLFGRIDRRFLMGAYVTDHMLLKPGSFARANDGYLVLDIRGLLANPLSWETMKRVIKTKEVRPEDPAEAMGIVVPQSIKPEPMPLNVKVIVTGDPLVYNLLAEYDEDFWETFKVHADFDTQIKRTEQHLDAYAAFICSAANRHGILHFSPEGVGRVVEYAARLTADQARLSTRFGLLTDLLIEADFWARKEKQAMVGAAHVQRALEEKLYRSNLIAERIQELMEEGTLMVDTDGAVEGQINGLAVLAAGDIAFGKPSRITARTFLGRGGVINIEREAQLSGKTHDKGVLIISGYLGWKYAQERPLSVSATIAFEQSYDGVDGDSASSTEVYAILSSLAGVPLRQDLAVTGSVNQKGEIQPIGGVNQKIEGFFDLCKAKGLDGKHGVLIPKQNVRNLMLRDDVVDAVAQGKFHIYAVGAIDEGIELLTGVPAGERDASGNYPDGTVSFLVDKRLREYSERFKAAAPYPTEAASQGANNTAGGLS